MGVRLPVVIREITSRKKEAEEAKAKAERELAALRKKSEVEVAALRGKIAAVDWELATLRKENGRLRKLGERAQALDPLPEAKKDVGAQTPDPRRNVGAGAGAWSPDRVRALIDERMRAFYDGIVAEVCGDARDRAPAREEEMPPPRGRGPGSPASGWGAVVPDAGEKGEETDEGGDSACLSAVAA